MNESFGAQSETNPKYARLLTQGCTVVAFLTPLKLSWTYVALIPLLGYWLYVTLKERRLFSGMSPNLTIIAPLVFYTLVCIASAFFGLAPLHSIRPLISFCFFALALPLFIDRANVPAVLTALLAGQSISSAHSVLDGAMGGNLKSLFIGKVTESGQLAITILVALGVLSLMRRTAPSWKRLSPTTIGAMGVAMTAALSTVGFRTALKLPASITALLVAVIIAIPAAIFFLERGNGRRLQYSILLAVQLPIMAAALLVNLKRGPWLGVAVGTMIFSWFIAPRLFRWTALFAICAVAFVSPVRDRITASYDHFVISGGRSTIWRVGSELAAEYPLGIGFHNSEILRKFAPEVPPELRHFHNNFLNITAESGWLAAALFGWFILVIVSSCFRKPRSALPVAVGCAVISWQAAGLVEYNVGDSEVLLVAWIVLGVYLQLQMVARAAQTSGSATTSADFDDSVPIAPFEITRTTMS